MKIQHATKIKSVGNFLGFILGMVMVAAGAFLGGVNYQQKQIEENNHILPTEFYECFVGMMLKDPAQTKVCVAYRVKGINFDGNNNPRHREYNEEQGKRIHGIQ